MFPLPSVRLTGNRPELPPAQLKTTCCCFFFKETIRDKLDQDKPVSKLRHSSQSLFIRDNCHRLHPENKIPNAHTKGSPHLFFTAIGATQGETSFPSPAGASRTTVGSCEFCKLGTLSDTSTLSHRWGIKAINTRMRIWEKQNRDKTRLGTREWEPERGNLESAPQGASVRCCSSAQWVMHSLLNVPQRFTRGETVLRKLRCATAVGWASASLPVKWL